MKPTPDRLVVESYPSQVEIPSRFSDVDMFRHLNNVAIGQFYEEVRFALAARMRTGLPPEAGGRIVVVNVDTAYLREARYPGLITVGSGLVQRGNKSYVLGQALFQAGVCFSTADTTFVYMEKIGPAVLPSEFDEVFESLRMKSSVDNRQ